MDDPGIAAKLVEALDASFPDGRQDLRPVHTFGIGATGFFEASDVARDYSIAEHFQGQQIRIVARFSNGSGSGVQHDGWSDVRGLAIRFQLANGAAADLIAMTLNEFFTPTVETFLKFSPATIPIAAERESTWLKIFDMLRLILPMDDPYPGQKTEAVTGALKFANNHSYAQLPVFQAGALGAPVSYARATYHAVHTFVVVAPDGVRRPVRFTWQPVSGVLTTDRTAPPSDKYLQQEICDRLAKGPARFILMMTIGEIGDDFDNPSRPWPPHRVRVVMGTLTLDAVPDDQVANGELLSFNPWRLVPGIEPSDDPILRARRDAYEYSRNRRKAPPGCPFSRS
jgi:catalase